MIKKYCVTLAIIISIFTHASLQAQWTSQGVPEDIGMLLDIDFPNELKGVAGGWFLQGDFRGRAIYTSDGGKSWQSSILPDSARAITGIQMINSRTGYASGAYNISLFATGKTSPGKTMPAITYSSLNKNPLLMKGISTNARAANSPQSMWDSYKGLFLKTTDGGMSFQSLGQLPEGVEYLTGLSFIDETTGYASAIGREATFGRILKTRNGGESWTEVPFNDSLLYLKNTIFKDKDHGIAYGYKGNAEGFTDAVIFYTSNGGTSWKTSGFPSSERIEDVCFTSRSTGYAVGIEGDVAHTKSLLYKTTDGGESWRQMGSPSEDEYIMINGIHFAEGTGLGVIYGVRQELSGSYRAFISRTNNGGISWSEQALSDSFAGYHLLAGESVTDTSWYIAGGDWTKAVMLHLSESGTSVVSVNDQENDKGFGLSQNYPNPFNPRTVIRYQIKGISHVSLSIFDALGHEIKRLVDEIEPAGSHEVTFENGSDNRALSSGIYFYKIEVRAISGSLDESFTDTKKFTLMK